MKKTILLLTIICIGQLYGMEKEIEKGNLGAFEQLPKELRQEIMQMALKKSTNFDEAIKAIQNASAMYGGVKLNTTAAINLLKETLLNNINLFPNDFNQTIDIATSLPINNLENFTKVVHILADHFDTITTRISVLFNSSIAKKYNALGYSLLDFAGDRRESAQNKIIELINQGADVNFSAYKTPLELAIDHHNLVNVQLLLKLGAIPINYELQLAKMRAQWNPDNQEAIAIKNLIEESMKQ